MKKAMLFVLMLAFGASMAYAATTRETVKSTSGKMGSFWSREAQRAGWKDSTNSWGNFWSNANPVNFFKNQQDAYNARKTGAGAAPTTAAIAK